MSLPRIRREAVLDVGSNSVRLLVADLSRETLAPVYQQKITCRLISGMTGGMLSRAAIDRTRAAIRTLCDQARERGAEHVYAFGTSAMRDGENSGEIVNDARAYGVRFAVLPGEDEARLAYSAIAPGGRVGVIDIGGGSTEYMAGEDGAVVTACSAPLGAVRFADMLPGETDPETLCARAGEILAPCAARAAQARPDKWVGEGGTVTALAAVRLALTQYEEQKIQDCPVDRAWLEEALVKLCAMDAQARRRVPGMEEKRADIIHYGAAILLESMRLLNANVVLASAHDNLAGYMQTVVRREVLEANG